MKCLLISVASAFKYYFLLFMSNLPCTLWCLIEGGQNKWGVGLEKHPEVKYCTSYTVMHYGKINVIYGSKYFIKTCLIAFPWPSLGSVLDE